MTQDSLQHRRKIRSFVVRAGRMTAGQQRAWQELWPQIGIEYRGERLDLDSIFKRRAPRMMEIGFGTGDALLAFAAAHPEFDCVGVEVHPPGIGHALLGIQAQSLSQVRLMCHDAVEVLTHCIANASLDEVHIFFPDPWHKKRHHKRRLIQLSFLDELARVLKPNALAKLATDWENYADHITAVFNAHSAFSNAAKERDASQLYVERPAHRPLTRFERRGHRLGHGVWDFAYRRCPSLAPQ